MSNIGSHDHADGSQGGPTLNPSELEVSAESAVLAHATSNISLTGGATSAITADTEDNDTRDEYDPSTGHFVPDKSGLYLVFARARFQVNADGDDLEVRLQDTDGGNTITRAIAHAGDTTDVVVQLADVVTLTAGTTYQFEAQNADGDDTVEGNQPDTRVGVVRLVTQ